MDRQPRGADRDGRDDGVVTRPRLTRESFNALLLASRQVDRESLRQVADDQQALELEGAAALAAQVTRYRRPLSSFLISTTFHLLLFLVLTLAIVPWSRSPAVMEIEAVLVADPLPQELRDQPDQATVEIDLPELTQSPVESTMDDTSLTENLTVADASTPVPSPLDDAAVPESVSPTVPVAPLPAQPSGGGLEGRDEASRAALAANRGGSAASEAAVEKGLAWIIEHQHPDGSWRLRFDHGACLGQCPDEGLMESTTAATGLALMSLLGAGYTHESGPYQEQVRNGLEFLVQSIRFNRRGGSLAKGDRGMYSHAIATIALSEALAMTGDTWLVDPVESTRRYIQSAQHRRGGWRYNPGNAGDMTVTGWQLMALKSCQLSNFNTPPEVWQQAETFIDSLRTSSGYYGYLKPSEHPTTTAVAALMKMYLGAGRDQADVETAANYVAGIGPSETDMYFNYYGTQVLFHRGGKDWRQWNENLRDYLIETQDQSGTHRTGSWHFRDPHGSIGGRLYTTAMAIMTLEVYYRYMPLYDRRAVADPLPAP